MVSLRTINNFLPSTLDSSYPEGPLLNHALSSESALDCDKFIRNAIFGSFDRNRLFTASG